MKEAERNLLQNGSSYILGTCVMFLVEILAQTPSPEKNELYNLYLENGLASRAIVAATVASISFVIAEKILPEPEYF